MRQRSVAAVVLGCMALPLVLGGCVKPLRALSPEAHGMTCAADGICVEDPATFDEARTLTQTATAFVAENLSPLQRPSEVLFCKTEACFSTFGHPEFAAMHVGGTHQIVISEVGWHDHILRHELIHLWQQEQFGFWPYVRGLPRWYIEGMAYVLSDDPRAAIPNAAAQGYRKEFEAWTAAGNDWRQPPVALSP